VAWFNSLVQLINRIMTPETREYFKRAHPDWIKDKFYSPITFIFTESGRLFWKYYGVHADILEDDPKAAPEIFKNHPDLQQKIQAQPDLMRSLVDDVALTGRISHGIQGPVGRETFNVLALWNSKLLSKLPQLVETLKGTNDKEGNPLIDDNYIITIVGHTPMSVKEAQSSAGQADPCQDISFRIDGHPWKLSQLQAALHQTKGSELVKIKCGVCPGIEGVIGNLEKKGCDSVAGMVRDISNRLRCGSGDEAGYCLASARADIRNKLGDPAYTNSLSKRELERQWDMVRPKECVLNFKEWLIYSESSK
jgi:hypothetical protein